LFIFQGVHEIAALSFCSFYQEKEKGLRGPSGASRARKASPSDKHNRILTRKSGTKIPNFTTILKINKLIQIHS